VRRGKTRGGKNKCEKQNRYRGLVKVLHFLQNVVGFVHGGTSKAFRNDGFQPPNRGRLTAVIIVRSGEK
jgi:hypothetical protein